MVSLKCQEMSAAKSNGKPQFIRIYEQLAARKEGRKEGGTGIRAVFESKLYLNLKFNLIKIY